MNKARQETKRFVGWNSENAFQSHKHYKIISSAFSFLHLSFTKYLFLFKRLIVARPARFFFLGGGGSELGHFFFFCFLGDDLRLRLLSRHVDSNVISRREILLTPVTVRDWLLGDQRWTRTIVCKQRAKESKKNSRFSLKKIVEITKWHIFEIKNVS